MEGRGEYNGAAVWCCHKVVYHSTLATLTLIILFSETLKEIQFFPFQIANFVREIIECSRIFFFSEMKISNLINYLTDMC